MVRVGVAGVYWRTEDQEAEDVQLLRIDWRLANALSGLEEETGSITNRDLTITVDFDGETPTYVPHSHRKKRAAGPHEAPNLIDVLVAERESHRSTPITNKPGISPRSDEVLMAGWLADGVEHLNNLSKSPAMRLVVSEVRQLRALLREVGLGRNTIDRIVRTLERSRPTATGDRAPLCPRCHGSAKPIIDEMNADGLALALADAGAIEVAGRRPDDVRYRCRSCSLRFDDAWTRLETTPSPGMQQSGTSP